jgi:hypothetical protein
VDVFAPRNSQEPVFSAVKQCTSNWNKTKSHFNVKNLLDGSVVKIALLGDPMGKAGVVVVGEHHIIAKIIKPLTLGELLTKRTYTVEIALGVDVAFAAMVVVLEISLRTLFGTGGLVGP